MVRDSYTVQQQTFGGYLKEGGKRTEGKRGEGKGGEGERKGREGRRGLEHHLRKASHLL